MFKSRNIETLKCYLPWNKQRFKLRARAILCKSEHQTLQFVMALYPKVRATVFTDFIT